MFLTFLSKLFPLCVSFDGACLFEDYQIENRFLSSL